MPIDYSKYGFTAMDFQEIRALGSSFEGQTRKVAMALQIVYDFSRNGQADKITSEMGLAATTIENLIITAITQSNAPVHEDLSKTFSSAYYMAGRAKLIRLYNKVAKDLIGQP
jgi:hypothetical protein